MLALQLQQSGTDTSPVRVITALCPDYKRTLMKVMPGSQKVVDVFWSPRVTDPILCNGLRNLSTMCLVGSQLQDSTTLLQYLHGLRDYLVSLDPYDPSFIRICKELATL